jgi:tetratricopeptide (TPR) repeat protein
MLTSPDNPQQRITGHAATAAEYANLTTALAHGLRTSQPIINIIATLNEYLDQVQQHDARRQLLNDAISAYPSPSSDDQRIELVMLNDLAGHAAIRSHRLDDAKSRYETVLRLLDAAGNRRALSPVYHQLGIIAEEQRLFAEAEASYRRALDIMLEFGDRRNAAGTYHQLGNVAHEQRRFAEAEASYRQALEIFLEFGDRPHTADTYHQLGMVAQQQKRFAEAEANYRRALDMTLEFGDRHSAATTYHQLGRVAQEQRRFAEAEASPRPRPTTGGPSTSS